MSVGVVPWTGVVLRAQTVVVDARTVVVGARTVTLPRCSFGSRSSMSYGCLPVGDDRAIPEIVVKSSVDETF